MATLVLMYRVATSPEVSELVKYRNAHGLSGWLPMEAPYNRKLHIICPSVPELDFPLVVPDNLGLYGPIALDASPIDIADPEMKTRSKHTTRVRRYPAHFIRKPVNRNGDCGGTRHNERYFDPLPG
jgi:hypothetical protein